jgi:hypothetical protein
MRVPPEPAVRHPPASPPRGGLAAVEVLLPVWGPRHIEQFLETSLPTLLAPGNVPALADKLPCGFVLMTRSSDAERIRRHPLWQRLGEVCEAQVRAIDDLISEGNHAVTLTLAYERAIRAAGAAMRDTCFILLVADYLLSDGSLAAVLARVEAGASAVLTGTPQVVSEDALRWMREQVRDRSGAVALPARTLMRWSLGHLHPATAASFVDFAATHPAQVNRLFWRAGADAMIGRFYLMHPIALRPELDDFTIGAACDYSFVPEMCPSGRVAVMTDSDEFLAVEMQPRAYHAGNVRWGGIGTRRLARGLSQWTTAQHRENATHTLVFHAGPVGKEVARAAREADAFVARVGGHLSVRPQAHRDHPYWVGSMAIHRAAAGGDAGKPNAGGGLETLLWRLRFTVLGRPPRVSILHARWPEFHALRRAVAASHKAGQRLGVVATAPEAFAGWLQGPRSRTLTLPSYRLLEEPDEPAAQSTRFDTCVLLVSGQETERMVELAARAAARLAPGGTMVVCLNNGLADAAATLGEDVAADMAQLAALGLSLRGARYVGLATTRGALQQMILALARATRRNRMYLPLAAAAIPLLCAATALANILTLGRRGPPMLGACSAVVLTLTASTQPSAQMHGLPVPATAKAPQHAALEGVAG